MYNILMLGTSGLSRYLTQHKREEVHILAYLDSFENGYAINGIPVIGEDEIHNYTYDYFVIACTNFEKGKELLLNLGVPAEKIIGYQYQGQVEYSDNILQKQCDDFCREFLRSQHINTLFDVPERKYYLCTMNIPENQKIIEYDFVREQTLDLLSKEIVRKNLAGDMAEIGVAQGQFARLINSVLPEKQLYLFDTFEGYPKCDIQADPYLTWSDKRNKFKDTTEEFVLSIMPHPEKCTIKKGIFPDTFDLEDRSFCFVSLDVNLYSPTKSALEVLYPRLVPGGYIMAHDYNNFVFHGVKQAIQEYCDANHVSYTPIPDICGTIIITK